MNTATIPLTDALVRRVARELGRRAGTKAQSLRTLEERTRIATLASRKRWSGHTPLPRRILGTLKTGTRRVTEIIKLTHSHRASVAVALVKLCKHGKVVRVARGWYRLPDNEEQIA